MKQLYRLKADDDLLVHPLDSLTAIYQAKSGITHLVSDPVPAILRQLTDRFAESGEVAALLAREFELEAGVDAEAVVAARLDELWQLGLVERRQKT